VEYSRRDLGILLPLLAAGAAEAQSTKSLPTTVFKYEDLPVTVSGEIKGRRVFDTHTHTGYHVDMHLTELGPGLAPHPAHSHPHEELLMLRTGVLDVTFKGKTIRAIAGSVVYVEGGIEHGWRNPGPARAEYFVVALGREG